MIANRTALLVAVLVTTVLGMGDLSAQMVIAESTFDSSDEGWLVGGPTPQAPDYLASGGNPGGFVRGFDASGSTGGRAFWAFVAPPGYLGNLSGAYDGTLSFDLRQSLAGGTPFDDDDVTLIGGGLTLVIDAGPNPASSWTSYSVSLVESAGWVLDGTTQPPTMSEMQTVLGNLSELWIRGEFIAGNDSADLDNVVLTGTGVSTMNGPTLLLLAGLLILISAAALRHLSR
jgi:hypothetical protein